MPDHDRHRRPGPAAASPSRAAPPSSTLEGTVLRVTFYNPETSFSVVQVRPRGRRDPVPVVGTLPQVHPGEWLLAHGQWQTDPRHGAQFRAAGVEVRPPATLDDVVSYLGSGFIRLLGPTLARRIVAHFGEATLTVLDTAPDRVREVNGIAPCAPWRPRWPRARSMRASPPASWRPTATRRPG